MTEQPTKSVDFTENQLIALGRTVAFWLEAHSGVPLPLESDEVQTLIVLIDVVAIIALALDIEKPSMDLIKVNIFHREEEKP